MRSLLPDPNTLPTSLHLLLEYVKSFSTPISEKKHYFCCDCLLETDNNEKCKQCESDKKPGVFYDFPVDAQIKHMFERRNLANLIDANRPNHDDSNEFISDHSRNIVGII